MDQNITPECPNDGTPMIEAGGDHICPTCGLSSMGAAPETDEDYLESVCRSLETQAASLEKQATTLRKTASLMRHPHFRNSIRNK